MGGEEHLERGVWRDVHRLTDGQRLGAPHVLCVLLVHQQRELLLCVPLMDASRRSRAQSLRSHHHTASYLVSVYQLCPPTGLELSEDTDSVRQHVARSDRGPVGSRAQVTQV